jgi:hypothetical protein
MTMQSPGKIYVALSTGQNIANLLPILELYAPGDRVVWIESAFAHDRGWTLGPSQVLNQRGIPHETVTCADDDPDTLHRALFNRFEREDLGKVRLIANGGTKLQMLAAFRALSNHLDEVLYGQHPACLLERYPQGRLAPVARTPYFRHQLQLEELIACNGMEIVDGRQECIWPGEPLPLGAFGADPAYTQDCYSRLWSWVKTHAPAPGAKLLPYSEAVNLAPKQAALLLENIRDSCQLGANATIKHAKAKAIYHSAGKLDQEARRALPTPTNGEHIPDIGQEFERATAARLVNWLINDEQFHGVVQSVWRNVHIRKQGANDIKAELDIALLLKNGVLLHLECKSWDATRKDLDARFSTLRDIASQLAKLVICLPSFPTLEEAAWHQALIRNVQMIADWKQYPTIKFTLPGAPDDDGMTFEDNLRKWLTPYLPRANKQSTPTEQPL